MKIAISVPDPVFAAGKADSGLAKPSVVNLSQLFTVDRALLAERLRALPAEAMQRVDDGLRLALGL
jgi:mRNA interferase MazF